MDVRERLKKQVEANREAFEASVAAPTGSTAEDEAAAAEAARVAAEEAARVTPPEPAAPAAAATPDTATAVELAAARAEVARLTRELEDANNPTWKQRYSSLQGMFNGVSDELKSLKAEVAELKAKPAAVAAPEPPDTTEYDALVEEVGEKAAKIIMKQREDSKKQLEEAVGAVKGELEATKGEVKTAAEKANALEQGTAYERFMTDLTAKVPDWQKLNGWDGIPQDPKFTEFLTQRAPGTAKTYDRLLNEHYAAGDVQQVAEIFELGKKHTAPAAPAAADPPPTPEQRAAAHVEPSKTASGTTEPNGKKEMIPESERKAFHDSVRRRTFKGTSAELAQLTAKYRQAGIEGRILFGQ